MATSESMQAWCLPAFNENAKKAIESLTLEEVDTPKPEEGQLLLKVSYASLNPIDWKLFTGSYQESGCPIDRFPYTPGFDVAGTVMTAALGFNIGDRVCANVGLLESCKDPAPLPGGPAGALAKFVVVPANACVKLPSQSMKFKDVAGLPLAGVTAYQALFGKDMSGMNGEPLGDASPGKKVLILGGSSGVGSLAVQLAKKKGECFVCATASSNKIRGANDVTKKELVELLGADVVLDYEKEDWGEKLAGADYDLIFDCVGIPEDLTERAPKVLKKGGRFVSIANFNGETSDDLHFACFLVKAKQDHLQELVEMVEKGDLAVLLDSEFEFTDVKKAFERCHDGHASGKILINVG